MHAECNALLWTPHQNPLSEGSAAQALPATHWALFIAPEHDGAQVQVQL